MHLIVDQPKLKQKSKSHCLKLADGDESDGAEAARGEVVLRMMDTEANIKDDAEFQFAIEDYCKVTAMLWRMQYDRGNEYTVRLVNSVMSVLTEARKQQ